MVFLLVCWKAQAGDVYIALAHTRGRLWVPGASGGLWAHRVTVRGLYIQPGSVGGPDARPSDGAKTETL